MWNELFEIFKVHHINIFQNDCINYAFLEFIMNIQNIKIAVCNCAFDNICKAYAATHGSIYFM